MTRLGFLRVLVVLDTASPVLLPAAEFYVAPQGDDASSGSKELPFATLERARDAVRAMIAATTYPTEGITVWLRGGVYQRNRSFDLDARDSGKAGAPVVYAASAGETARLVGGRTIPASAFRPVVDAFFWIASSVALRGGTCCRWI